jgi:hypothetical protein
MKTVLAILALILLIVPAHAGGCYPSYNYGYSQTYYQPFYYYPTLPTYCQSYSYPTYQQSYTSHTNYYDGQYHYHNAGSYAGTNYPSGYYKWANSNWVKQDWRQEVIEIAKQREENKEFMAAMKLLGMEAPPQPQIQMPYVPYTNRSPYLGTYGANARTIYSYSSVKDLYGGNDVNTALQQVNRLALNAQQMGGQATQDAMQVIGREGDNRRDVARILAAGQAAQEVLKAAQEPHQREESRGVIQRDDAQQSQEEYEDDPRLQQVDPRLQQRQQQQQSPRPVQPRGQGQGKASLPFAAAAKCIQCHGPSKQEGKFSILAYEGMSRKEKAERVWPRLTTRDKQHRMPKDGDPLTPEEMMEFFSR